MSHGMNLVVAVKLFDVNKTVVCINCNNAWKYAYLRISLSHVLIYELEAQI